jgi:hypothetical protein
MPDEDFFVEVKTVQELVAALSRFDPQASVGVRIGSREKNVWCVEEDTDGAPVVVGN